MEIFISDSPEKTEQIAANFAKRLGGGEVIAYRGGLGMGKTCFTRGLALGLGYNGDVTSPTFALINEYIGGKFPLYHFGTNFILRDFLSILKKTELLRRSGARILKTLCR